jgi:hypothetical protein
LGGYHNNWFLAMCNLLRVSSPTTMSTSFSSAHRLYVKSLYRRMLKNELDWVVRRDIWRGRAMMIRAEFERNWLVLDVKLVATLV